MKKYKDIVISLKENKSKKCKLKVVRFWLILFLTLVLSLSALSMPFNYTLQKHILRVVCEPYSISQPYNYDEILHNTEITKDVSYNSVYANGYMDIISPKNNEELLPLFVYYHGGYYIVGDKSGAEPYCRMIANEDYIVVM